MDQLAPMGLGGVPTCAMSSALLAASSLVGSGSGLLGQIADIAFGAENIKLQKQSLAQQKELTYASLKTQLVAPVVEAYASGLATKAQVEARASQLAGSGASASTIYASTMGQKGVWVNGNFVGGVQQAQSFARQHTNMGFGQNGTPIVIRESKGRTPRVATTGFENPVYEPDGAAFNFNNVTTTWKQPSRRPSVDVWTNNPLYVPPGQINVVDHAPITGSSSIFV
uniref:VP2 n=1 Tax=Grey teal calicivirus TaxID=2592487 RepID=A0A5B8JMM9_9CALI|nr:VP2 [Grey teal calicivirus]